MQLSHNLKDSTNTVSENLLQKEIKHEYSHQTSYWRISATWHHRAIHTDLLVHFASPVPSRMDRSQICTSNHCDCRSCWICHPQASLIQLVEL